MGALEIESTTPASPTAMHRGRMAAALLAAAQEGRRPSGQAKKDSSRRKSGTKPKILAAQQHER